jgi:hypothetical protein
MPARIEDFILIVVPREDWFRLTWIEGKNSDGDQRLFIVDVAELTPPSGGKAGQDEAQAFRSSSCGYTV